MQVVEEVVLRMVQKAQEVLVEEKKDKALEIRLLLEEQSTQVVEVVEQELEEQPMAGLEVQE
jgi:hypothetical protein